MKKIFCINVLLFGSLTFMIGQIRINEICSSNATIISDPIFKKYSDWIEISNNGATDINLQNCYITDDPLNLKKQVFKDTFIIKAGGYILLWADGKDTINYIGFKLNREGETIILSGPKLNLIDSVTYPPLNIDNSFGRQPGDNSKWVYYKTPTPGKANNGSFYNGISDIPVFETKAGYYKDTAIVGLSSRGEIHYTINTDEPTISSKLYSGPFKISKTNVVRAIAVENSKLPSNIVAHTYFINDSSKLPVVSVSTAPANLWDNKIGIYVVGTNGIADNCFGLANWNQDWERPANFEMFDLNKNEVISAGVGIKIAGACSRAFAQKSLAVIARSEYGTNILEYPIFNAKPATEYGSILLRDHGNDFNRAMMRDAVIQKTICKKMNIDYQEYQPALVYLNGEYWGIQEIREKIDANYITSNYGIKPEAIDLIEQIGPNLTGDTYGANQGDAAHFKSLVSFMESHDLSNQVNYEYIKNQIDIEEYINYNVAEIYVNNTDWPGNNVKIWRHRTSGGKYKWMLYDTDFGLGLGNPVDFNSLAAANSTNGPSWPNPPYSTFILRQLLKNQEFKTKFINTFIFHINTTFKAENFIKVTDSITNLVLPEIKRHQTRWGLSNSYWLSEIESMKTFAQKRPTYVFQHLIDFFSLGAIFSVSIENQNSNLGKLSIIGNDFNDSIYIGKHLSSVPLTVEAIPKVGNFFDGWYIYKAATGYKIYSHSPTIEINSKDTNKYSVKFSKGVPVVITEINTSPVQGGAFRFVECYNQSGDTIDIEGIKIEGNIHFIFPPKSIINPYEYFIIAADTSKYPSVKGYQWDSTTLQLSGVIILKDKNNRLIDSVNFTNQSPWPVNISNSNFSIELSDLGEDNLIGQNWHLSSISGGTPGIKNSIPTTPVKVLINEVVPGNQLYYGDEKGQFSDLIELFNASEIPVNVENYILTHDTMLGSYFRIPENHPDLTTIPPKGYLVFWADGDSASGTLHTNFKINKTNDIIELLDKDFNKLDKISIKNMLSGQSVSLYPDGGDTIAVTAYPTPGFTNLLLNNIPVFLSMPQLNAHVNVPYSYLVKVSDLDINDKITLTGRQLPSWLTLTSLGNGTATLTGTPYAEGIDKVKIEAKENDPLFLITQAFSITVDNPGTKIDNLNSNRATVYPNPGNGLFYIRSINDKFENVGIKIFDMTGRIVYQVRQFDKNLNFIDLTGQSKGMYIIKISYPENVITKKIIIN